MAVEKKKLSGRPGYKALVDMYLHMTFAWHNAHHILYCRPKFNHAEGLDMSMQERGDFIYARLVHVVGKPLPLHEVRGNELLIYNHP